MAGKLSNLFKGFFDSEKVGGLLLIICTVISLIIANSSFGAAYVHFIHSKLDLSFSSVALNYSIEHWVNDGLMTIFFLMVGLEVERELYKGELSDFKKAILPVAAAIGGMVVPAFIHFLLNKGTATQSGFAIPMATDIAFALGILALVGNKVPVSVKVFLTALAIIDDIGAIIIIALFYTKTLSFLYLLIALLIFGLLLVFNKLKIKKLIFYLLPGVIMWYCFLRSGVHATLSGVLLAFTIPFGKEDEKNISYRLEHWLQQPVAFIIVPIFALINTAIILPGNIAGSLLTKNSLGIILGLLVGKVVGITGSSLLLIKWGKAQLQEDMSYKSLIGLGFLAGIGFTMSMFISNLAFENPEFVTTSKLSILVGSAFSAMIGFIILKSSSKHNRNLL